MAHDLLIEIGTEELPPKSLRALATALQEEIERGLEARTVGFGSSHWYATPRRLAVLVENVQPQSADRVEVLWGPPVKVAFDGNGSPTRAALAFAERYDLDPQQLDAFVAHDGKTDKLCLRRTIAGEPVAALVGALVEEALAQLPIAKRMRWGSARHEFVRPIHWIVLLLDEQAIEHSFFATDGALAAFSPPVISGNRTRGHRFHANHDIELSHARDYRRVLEEQGQVQVDFSVRQELIETGVHAAAREAGGHAVIDADLLDEVTALVEWPQVLVGHFDDAFLEVPAEALISSMKEHQKYFHVISDSGHLLPLFVTVANIVSPKPGLVIAGNERVIRPRLADASFFYRTDLEQPLASRRAQLDSIVFQRQLGSLGDKVARIAALAAGIAGQIGAPSDAARRASELCKCDLVSSMVLEFDSLQGIMGRYYALHDGEDAAVASAIEEHYWPRFAGDRLPSGKIGACVALADRLDTLTGIFAIGEQPSGSRDPYGLRRASLGVLRILVDLDTDLDLRDLIETALAQHTAVERDASTADSVHAYILDRFSAWFEADGVSPLVFPAVRACESRHAGDIYRRVNAVAEFLRMPAASALAAANKRVANLLTRADLPAGDLDPGLFVEPAESALWESLQSVQNDVEPLLARHDYAAALQRMADLREPLDGFFEDVMVMCEEVALRGNRLALLHSVRQLYLRVADVSLLAVS